MSDFNTLQLLTDPRGFATLWLSREEKNNAFNAEMIRELILALDKVSNDASLRFFAGAWPRQAFQRRCRPGLDATIGRTRLPHQPRRRP